MIPSAQPGFPPASRKGFMRFCREVFSGRSSEGSLKPGSHPFPVNPFNTRIRICCLIDKTFKITIWLNVRGISHFTVVVKRPFLKNPLLMSERERFVKMKGVNNIRIVVKPEFFECVCRIPVRRADNDFTCRIEPSDFFDGSFREVVPFIRINISDFVQKFKRNVRPVM